MRNVPKTEPSVCDSWQYFTLSPLVYLTLFGGCRLSLGLFNDKESYVQSYLLPDPTPFFFCQQMHFVFQSDCGCRWIKSFRKQTRVFQPHKDFLLFCRECTFSPLISKVSRRVSTLHNSFFLSTALRRRSFTSPNRICAGAQLCQSSFVKVHRSLKSIVLLYPIQL